MKTLTNQTLIYDEDCPLCRAYTTAFVKTGMLDEQGRASFCILAEQEIDYIDIKRASNEIALVDWKNKTVTYGIDSLINVLGNLFPMVYKIGHIKPVHFLLEKLYAFVSYNRKVIIPGKPGVQLQCIPDFNFRYRLLYILFAIAITALALDAYAKKIILIPEGSFTRELILASGQVIFQAMFLFQKNRKTVLAYAGNLMTVSLMGALLLMPMLILNAFTPLPQMAILGWFGVTVGVMFLEHYRRVHLLKLPLILCLTWILYRIIALFFILN